VVYSLVTTMKRIGKTQLDRHQLLAEKPKYEAFAEAMSELLTYQLDPDLWGPQPWPAWKWATMLIATDWAVEQIGRVSRITEPESALTKTWM